VLLTLHAPNHAPFPVSMDQSERHRFGTVLSDPVVVMLIDLAQVSPRPGKQTAAKHPFQIQRDPHARCVVVPLQCERGTNDEEQCKVCGQPRVHLAQLPQIDRHAGDCN